MDFALSARAAAAGHRLLAFETIGSTNAEALERARAGERGPLWIVTAAQTAGRGRRGRPWRDGVGNLAASLLIALDVPIGTAGTLGFVAGLALAAAIERTAATGLRLAADGASGTAAGKAARMQLKWPNDVVSDGGKVAGILLESEPVGSGALAVVTGIGVNVTSAPADLPYPAAALNDLGAATDAATLFTALTDAWVELYQVWDGGGGLPEIRKRWLEHAAGLGAAVAVKSGERVIRGVFETLDEEGRLVVRGPDNELIAISAGDVHFGGVATVPAVAPRSA